MGVFAMITKVFVLCLIAALSSADDRTLDWTQLLGAGIGAGAGAVPGAATGGLLGSLAGGALINNPLLGGLGGAAAGGGVGAATGAVAAPAVSGLVDDVLGGGGKSGG